MEGDKQIMSEYIDERIVSIKFDNSGFEQKVSETQQSLNELNQSLTFDGAEKGADQLTKAFKEVSDEAKKADLTPLGESVENVKEKFSALETIAVGALLKIGSQAVELGEKLIKSVAIDPIKQGFDKYQSILTSQMTLTAALGGETEAEVEANAQLIKDTLDQLAWYADETSYSLDDMVKNVSQFANYGIALDDAKTAMMGIANASAKSGAPLAMASHAMEGFSKAMGQGYMSYQVWRTWLNSSKITTLDFKNTFIETAKEMMKGGAQLSDNIRLMGDDLEYYAGKNEGWLRVTAENIESSLTKGKWLTSDVMLAGLAKYSASMDDLYEATEHGSVAVSELFDNAEYGFDKFSTEAFKYAQQCKTLNDVIDALFDATSTTWYRIFQSLIGDYKETVALWSDFAEYLFEWFVYPLQDVAEMIENFANTTSNVKDEVTGDFMTMREVIVDSFMNILEAISSVINPIKEAFQAVFNPFETLPEKLQNGVEGFHDFTESLILTEEEADKLRATMITVFTVIKKIWTVITTVINVIKTALQPIVKKVSEYVISILKTVGTALIKLLSTVSTFLSKVLGIPDIVADIKDSIIEAAEAIDELTAAEEGHAKASADMIDEYKTHKDYIDQYTDSAYDAADAIKELSEEEEEAAKKAEKTAAKAEKSYAIPGGYSGEAYLSYAQAQEKLNHKLLAEFIEENKITEQQYTSFVSLLEARENGAKVYYNDLVQIMDGNEKAAHRMMILIEDSLVAYKETAKTIETIKNRDLEQVATQYETVLDGVYEAQKKTAIKQGDLDVLLDLYFNKNIKNTKEISEKIGIEEWKVRELTTAYQEAYDVENYLNKHKQKATAENINAAREELGYIEKKKEETQKLSGIAAAEARRAERDAAREERRQKYADLRAGKKTKEEPFKASLDVSRAINHATEMMEYYDRTADELPVTTANAFSEIAESSDNVSTSIDSITSASEKAADSVKSSSSYMAEAFKNLDASTDSSAKNIAKNVEKVADAASKSASQVEKKEQSKSDKKVEQKSKSLADQVREAFGDSTTAVESDMNPVFENIKNKLLEIFEFVKGKFAEYFPGIKEKVEAFIFSVLLYVKQLPNIIKTKFEELKEKGKALIFSLLVYIKQLPNIIKTKFTEIAGIIKEKILGAWDYITSKSLSEHLETIKAKWYELLDALSIIWAHLKNMSGQLALDLDGFFSHPLESLKKVAKTIKTTIKNIWNELVHGNDAEGVMGASAVLDAPSLSKTLWTNIKTALETLWGNIKEFFKTKANEIRMDEHHPLHWLITGFDYIREKFEEFRDYLGGIIESIKDKFDGIGEKVIAFKNKIKTTIDKIKSAFQVVFGEGSFFDKLADSKFWQPSVDAFINIMDTLDGLKIKLDNLKTAIKDGIGGAAENANTTVGKLVQKVKDWADEVKNVFKLFWEDVEYVRGTLEGERTDDSEVGGLAKIIGTILKKFDDFVANIKDGLDWDTIIKIEELERVLERLIGAISKAWLRLGIADMARDIGNFFSSIGDGIDNLGKAFDKHEGIGGSILEIAAAFALLAGSFILLGGMDASAIENATTALEAISAALAVLFTIIGGMMTLMNKSGFTYAGSLSEGLGTGLQNLFGNQNTMKQAAKLIIGIGAGLLLMSVALGVLIQATKDVEPEQIQLAVEILIGLGLVMVMLFGAIKVLLGSFTGSTGPGIKISPKQITKTVSPIAEIMKSLAVLIAVMVVAYVALIKVVDSFYDEAGKFDTARFAVVTSLFTLMVGSLFAMVIVLATLGKSLTKHEGFVKGGSDFGKSISGIMWAVIVGILAMVTAWKSIMKALDSAQNPDSWHQANLTIWTMVLAVMALLVVIALLAKWLSNGLKGDIALDKMMLSLVKVLAGITGALKLMASAYATIVTTIDSASVEAWNVANIVMLAMITALVILIMEAGILAKKLNPADAAIISTLGTFVLEIATSLALLAVAMKIMVNAFSTENTDAVNKALIVAGVFIGALIVLFGIIAGFSATGAGAVALETAAGILIAISASILMIAAAVLVLAVGLQEMVKALVMISSANEEIISGLETIRDALPIIAEIIAGTIAAVIGGIATGLLQAAADIAKAIVETFVMILELIAENAPRILEALRTIIPMIGEIISMIIAAALQALADNLPKLLEIILTFIEWLLKEVLPMLEEALLEFVRWLGQELGPELVKGIGAMWDAIHHLLIDTILPDIREFADTLVDTVLGMVDDLLANLHEHTVTWAEELIDWIVDYVNAIADGVPRIVDALGNLMDAVGDGILELCRKGGSFYAKLILIPSTIAEAFMDELKKQFGLKKDGKAEDKGIIMSLGENIVQGLIDGLGKLGEAIKKAAKKIWELFKAAFTSKDAADENSPSKAAYKLGAYVGEGLVNGINNSAEAVADSAKNLSNSFMKPMSKEIKEFSAMTSSMLSQLIDADMDFNPVITPVFDMTNLDYAAASMNRLFDSENAVEVAASFNTMKLGQEMEKLNQNVGKNEGTVEPATYNYVQNNYSPKALSPIEIYRRTHNQLTVAKNLAYGNAEGWVLV